MGAGRLLFAVWRPSAIRVRHSRLYNILGPYQASDCAAVATDALLVGGDSSVRFAHIRWRRLITGRFPRTKTGARKREGLLIPFLYLELVFLEVFWCREKKFAGFWETLAVCSPAPPPLSPLLLFWVRPLTGPTTPNSSSFAQNAEGVNPPQSVYPICNLCSEFSQKCGGFLAKKSSVFRICGISANAED